MTLKRREGATDKDLTAQTTETISQSSGMINSRNSDMNNSDRDEQEVNVDRANILDSEDAGANNEKLTRYNYNGSAEARNITDS